MVLCKYPHHRSVTLSSGRSGSVTLSTGFGGDVTLSGSTSPVLVLLNTGPSGRITVGTVPIVNA